MVFFALLVFLTPAAVIVLAQRLVQRRAPAIKLQPKSTLKQLKNGLINPRERSLFKRAFLSGCDYLWIATGQTTTSPPEEPAVVAWHEKLTDYMIERRLTFTEHHGYVLTCHDDEFQGLIGLIPPIYYNTAANPQWRLQLQRYAAVRPTVGPLVTTTANQQHQEDGSHARLESFLDTTTQRHGEIMKDKPHWYITLVGVPEGAQGQGVGRELVQQTLEQVTGNDRPIYLECHAENVPFFHKMGFELVDTFSVGSSSSSSSSDHQSLISDTLHYHAMVRPGRFHIV